MRRALPYILILLLLATVAIGQQTVRNNSTAYVAGGIGGVWNKVAGSDTIINVQNYGAVGDGVADDYTSLQNAIDAGCGIAALGGTPVARPNPVFMPVGRYSHSQPLRIPCAFLNFFGAGNNATQLVPSYTGPDILDEYYGQNNLNLVTSLETGSGNAMQWTTTDCFSSSTTCGRLYLSDVIGPAATNKLNGLAAFNVEFFFDPSSTPINTGIFPILRSHTTALSAAGAQDAFSLASNTLGDGKLIAKMDIGGSVQTITGPVLSNGTTYDISLDYDGSNMRLFVGTPGSTTTLYGPQAASGTVTQELFNVSDIPDYGDNHWPDQPNFILNAWAGTIDSIRISNVSRHTAVYTAPSTKFSADANTLLLVNFLTSGYVSDGLQKVEVGASALHYLAVRGGNSGAGTVSQQWLHDFYITGPLVAIWSYLSKVQNITLTNVGWTEETPGFNFYDNDYLGYRDHLYTTGFPIGISYGTADNSSIDIDNQVGVFNNTVVCQISSGNGGQAMYRPQCSDGGVVRYAFILLGDGNDYLSAPFGDFEAGNTVMLADVWMNGNTMTKIDAPEWTSKNSAPFYKVTGGGPVEIHAGSYAGTAAQAIHIDTLPTVPISMTGVPATFPGAAPLTDNTAWVVTPECTGSACSLGAITPIAIAALPTCTATANAPTSGWQFTINNEASGSYALRATPVATAGTGLIVPALCNGTTGNWECH